MKKFFVGIDFSKLKFDAAIYNGEKNDNANYQVFDNDTNGFKEFVKWVESQTKMDRTDWLICGEHTGLYSYALSLFLSENGIDIWLESGLQIKNSQGIQRGKTDKIDAFRIAEYAYRYNDKAKVFKPLSKSLDGLKDLLAYRERLVEAKKVFVISSKELKRVKRERTITDFIITESSLEIQSIELKIKTCEKKIEEIIQSEIDLCTNYKLLTSIKGIGMVNAVMVLTVTANFTLFTDPRKFGCHCGVVPFKHDSGTSVKGRTKISPLANRKIKTLLTQAARTCVMHDLEMKTYYQRKRAEGKSDKIVINNVRNKLIHRMFAVVMNGNMYNPNYLNPLKQVA